MTTRLFAVAGVAIAFMTLCVEAASSDGDGLVGLWKAKRWFSAPTHATLIIQRKGDGYTADLDGRVVPVIVNGQELSFHVPSVKGSFRGRLDSGTIRGFWYEPSALPVRLHARGPNRWIGSFDSSSDSITLYLLVRKRPDGTLSALMDNPEVDWAARLKVESIVRDGNVVKLTGKREADKEAPVVVTGTYDAENDTISLPFPNWRGTYDFKREGDESAFYEREKISRYVYHRPAAVDDGWSTQSPEDAEIDRAGLEATIQMLIDRPIDSIDTPLVDALLVARNGKLVLEEYFRGQTRETRHALRSAQKSLVSLLAGAVMQTGGPLTVSSPVYEVMNGGTFPPDLEPRKRAMTLEQLLTMTSGLSCDDWDDQSPYNEDAMWENQDKEPDFYRYALNLPMARDPGEKAFYCSAGANLALGVITRAVNEPAVDLFDRLIARPMKIDRYTWPFNRGGQPYGAGGASFRARDFLKFGQLMLDGGTWNGRRILSRDFAKRSTSPLYPLGRFRFGYLWWIHDYPYHDRTVRAFWAGGNGGQAVVVVPELGLVIATFGSNYNSAGSYYVQLDVIPKYVLPAVK